MSIIMIIRIFSLHRWARNYPLVNWRSPTRIWFSIRKENNQSSGLSNISSDMDLRWVFANYDCTFLTTLFQAGLFSFEAGRKTPTGKYSLLIGRNKTMIISDWLKWNITNLWLVDRSWCLRIQVQKSWEVVQSDPGSRERATREVTGQQIISGQHSRSSHWHSSHSTVSAHLGARSWPQLHQCWPGAWHSTGSHDQHCSTLQPRLPQHHPRAAQHITGQLWAQMSRVWEHLSWHQHSSSSSPHTTQSFIHSSQVTNIRELTWKEPPSVQTKPLN